MLGVKASHGVIAGFRKSSDRDRHLTYWTKFVHLSMRLNSAMFLNPTLFLNPNLSSFRKDNFILLALSLIIIVAVPATLHAQPFNVRVQPESSSALREALLEHGTIHFSNSTLGAFSVRVSQLSEHRRVTSIEGKDSSHSKDEGLFLGAGRVRLRRGVEKVNSANPEIPASISARLKSEEGKSSYARFRFTHPRGAGRVFEITIALDRGDHRLRKVSLRALSSTDCGLDHKIPDSATLNSADPQGSTQAAMTARETALSTKVFTVATDCDLECYTALGETAANDRILEFFNSVSTIYLKQLNYSFNVTSQKSRTTATTYPLTTTDAEDLLSVFQIRAPGLPAADLKHLVTGKNMQDNIVGLSFVGVVCNQPTFALGFSEHINSLVTPIILAHELGHNFSAIHDPNEQGIMSTRLSSPIPTAFSTFSVNQIASHVDGLGSLACYDIQNGSSSSTSSSASSSAGSSSSSSRGGGSDSGGGSSYQASLTAKLRGTNFTSTITQPQGSNCSVQFRVAPSEGKLSIASAVSFSSSITSLEKIILTASNMPKVKVKRSGQKALVWFDVTSSCTEGSATTDARSINVAIAPDKVRGKKTLKNTKSWINQLKSTLTRR